MTMTILKPTSAAELADAITDAAGTGTRLALRGGGSKATVGAPVEDAAVIDMTGFSGVIDYDPPELVLTVAAGAPLAEITALVAAQGQRLAFDPFDHGPLFGQPAGAATIGGVVAAGVAGSRRLALGSARDHVLGFHAVSGRGEAFVAGAKVVKNVTGYDLSKLVCGSWGRLVALTEITLKVLPAPRTETTRFLEGLDARTAQAAMARAMGSPAEICAAAHVPASLRGGNSLTVLRVEGFGPSVAARCAMLDELLGGFGTVGTLSETDAAALWSDLRTLAPLAGSPSLWRINVPPSAGPAVLDAVGTADGQWLMDWAGGLVWLGGDAAPDTVRAAAASAGGHATLVRAPAELRARVPALHPPARAVSQLEASIRRAFDPAGVFETGRFLDHAHAD